MARLLVCFLLFSCCHVLISSQDVKFPELREIFTEFYESEVEVTDLNQQASAFVKEYYDSVDDIGRLDTMVFGDRQSILYYGETDEILEINSTHCLRWDTGDSQFFIYELFYGWLNKNPLIIGPSGLMFFANNTRDEIVYEDQTVVRGIRCDKFTLNVTNWQDDFQIAYYFAVKEWTTAYQLEKNKLRVPVRIELNGWSSREAKANASAPVNQVNDYFYFKSTTDSINLQPSVGLGCPDREPTKDLPKIPKVFKFSAEVVDLKSKGDIDINFYQLWYDGPHKMGRLDEFKRNGFASYLYDFYSGITYVQKNGESCTILSLMDSFFEGYEYDTGLGYFKDPNELFGLTDEFYYMGKREIRGMQADVFEQAKLDTKIFGKPYSKLVTTVYFSVDTIESAVDGETETQIPLFFLITGYSSPLLNLTLQMQFNIFGFDDVVWPAMHTSFDLARCYPDSDKKSYFLLIFNVPLVLSQKMEGQNELFILRLKNQILFNSNITEQRLPLLKADYKSTGVYVTGLMLDRPPILKQFMSFGTWSRTHAHEVPKPIFDATTDEQCAIACVEETDFDCTGFYLCSKSCFLKKTNPLDGRETDEESELGECSMFIRAEKDSVIREVGLSEALKRLEGTVLDKKLQVDVDVGDRRTANATAEDIMIGQGPYSGKKDKPFEVVFTGFQIMSELDSTQEMDHVDTVNECYRSCKDSESLACQSFSYCPKATNKKCRISSIFISNTPDHKNYGDIEANSECNVYALSYLDFYEPLPGRVVMVPGQKSIPAVSSADECAKNCKTEAEFVCRGFEYCKHKKTCVLHSKHVLDLKSGDIIKTDDTVCTHYSAKFSADFIDMGIIIIDDDSNKRIEITLEECARACSEEMKTCKSFNFCPPSEPYMTDSSCSLTTQTRYDPNVKTTIKDNCHHYSKKKDVDDWGKVKSTNSVDNSGYTSKGFGSLVLGMLALGLILGVLGFFGYSYYKSKSTDEGLTVRFMKQADT